MRESALLRRECSGVSVHLAQDARFSFIRSTVIQLHAARRRSWRQMRRTRTAAATRRRAATTTRSWMRTMTRRRRRRRPTAAGAAGSWAAPSAAAWATTRTRSWTRTMSSASRASTRGGKCARRPRGPRGFRVCSLLQGLAGPLLMPRVGVRGWLPIACMGCMVRSYVPGMHGQRAADEAMPEMMSMRLRSGSLAALHVLPSFRRRGRRA